ncbi:MAG TPA: peptidoglycan-binding domain-containing protein [Candidatus Polarisedimenticolia bacterium]|jgi:hypothetical protein
MKRLLYVGCTPGNDVKLLQNDLNAVLALPDQKSAQGALEPDGGFGKKTLSRVQEFQRLNGLDADGVVGAKTLEVLSELLEEMPGAQAEQAPGGAAGGSGKVYEGGPPYGKPLTSTGAGAKTAGGGGYGGKSTGGGAVKGGGSGGGAKSWGKG